MELFSPKTTENKKVLLCEHKRHTAHHIASTRYAALSNGGGGYPIQSWWGGTPSSHGGGYPIQSWGGGTLSSHGRGYPRYPPGQTWDGVPPIQTWHGVPSHPDLGWGTPCPDLAWGTPPSRPVMGYPPRPGMGYPPRCELTNKLKTVPSLILRMRAVKINTLM